MKHLKRLLLSLAMLVITAGPVMAKDYKLHQAVLDNDITLIDRLIRKGLFIDEIGSRKYGYGSALHLAVREGHLEIAKLLLERGAQVDVLDPDDLTPLHNAAWNGNVEMTQLLLDAGADINASTYDGDTPLSLAQKNDQAQVAEFIQAKLQPAVTSEVKVESVATNDPGVIDISGTYIAETTASGSGMNYDTIKGIKRLNGKLIVLKQTGNTITGSVSTQSNWIISAQSDEINGTREENIISFYIIRGNQINGTWEINADGTEMVGKWDTDGAGGASGTWNLTKIGSDTAPIADVSGTYTIAELTYPREVIKSWRRWYLGTGKNLKMTIEQNGEVITGTFSGEASGEFEGVVRGNEITFNYDSVAAGSSSKGSAVLKASADSGELVGTFFMSGTSFGSYTGKWKFRKTGTGSPPSLTGTYISEVTGPYRSYKLGFLRNNPEVKLVQEGSKVTGTFEPDGKLWGEVNGDSVELSYFSNGYHGKVKWKVKPGSNGVIGTWAYDQTIGKDGNWNLTRIE